MGDDSRARAQVDRWELEWASCPGSHWGDRIEWGTARIIGDRLDGKATDPFGPDAGAATGPNLGSGRDVKTPIEPEQGDLVHQLARALKNVLDLPAAGNQGFMAGVHRGAARTALDRYGAFLGGKAQPADEALALLVEAAILFRAYERHHRDAYPTYNGEFGDALKALDEEKRSRIAKAERNAVMAAKIEAYIQTIGPDQLIPALEANVRAPVLEGLEPSPHRAGCECAQCWPVVYATGGMAVSEIKAAIPGATEGLG